MPKHGYKFSDESRAKMSASAKRRLSTPEGKETLLANHWSRNPAKAEAVKDILRAYATGKPVSEETRAKLSAASTGKKRSPEAIQKMCDAAKSREDRIAAQHEGNLGAGRYLPLGSLQTQKNGYVVEKVAHRSGNRNWQPHHRCVMERKIGRPLEKGEVVHHIDGDKTNNSEENLALLDARTHACINHVLAMLARCDEGVQEVFIRTLYARFPELSDYSPKAMKAE